MKRTITITFDHEGHVGWDVHENGKCCNGLGWDEMLGQIAALTISPSRVGNGFAMRTPKEWKKHHAAMESRRKAEAAERLRNGIPF